MSQEAFAVGAACRHTGPKFAWIGEQFVATEIGRMNLFKNGDQREEVLTNTWLRASMMRRANMKGLEMQSTMMTSVRQRGCAPKTFNDLARALVIDVAGFAPPAPSRTQGFWDVCW